MPSSVSKVKKSLNRRNHDITSLHAGSRNAKRLQRAAGRDNKLVKQAALRSKANEPYLDRVRYFQNAVTSSPDTKALSEKAFKALVDEYVLVYEPELKDVQAARRPGRPASTREDWLKHRLDQEKREYDVGYWVPDMLDEVNVEALLQWDGDWSMLSPIKFVRINRMGQMKDSRWPPNGMS